MSFLAEFHEIGQVVGHGYAGFYFGRGAIDEFRRRDIGLTLVA